MPAARPRLALIYDRAAVTPMELFEAGRPLADLIWVLDASDPPLEPLVPLVRRMGTLIDTAHSDAPETRSAVAAARPDGIMIFAEREVELAAQIASDLGLRFHSPATARLLANKHRQRLALADASVPGPAHWPVAAEADAASRAELASTLRYPVVLKPQAGLGSRYTVLVRDGAELLALLAEVDEAMLIEELLVGSRAGDQQRLGETVMVDSLVLDGRACHYALTGHFVPAPPFRGSGTFLPALLDAGEATAVLAATDAALVALGIEHGFTNTDLIMTPEGPRVLEVNGRIGGEIQTLLELAGGSGLLRAAMAAAIGAPSFEVGWRDAGVVSFCCYLQPPLEATRLLSLSGVEEVSALDGVTRVVLHGRAGDELDWRLGTSTRILTAYGVVGDHDELADLHARIMGELVADYDLSG